MGKQGPCCHCGISTTPLWRNGPPDKAVLCNACGSRWRTKGTLMNYMPMHAGGCGVKSDLTDMKLPHVKKGPPKTREQRPQKRKEPCDVYSEFDYAYQKMDYHLGIGYEEEASTRSSARSGISYSEGCVQPTFDAGRASGAERWPPWECPVPSKRRTFMYRHRPSTNKLSHAHPAFCKLNSSMYTCAPEEDLLVEYKPSSMTVEIGLGGVFIRPPVSKVQEQESQASSLIFDNRDFDHTVALKVDFTREESQVVGGAIKANLARGKEKARSSDPGRIHSVKNLTPNKVLLENFPYNKQDVLQSYQSPLVFLELKDIVNFDTFLGLLSDQEQLQLMKHLSLADVTSLPDSLKGMFNSVQFESALANFQLLLSEGVFDSLEAGLSRQVLQHYQQLLTVSDLTASGWMEQCSQIFNRSKRRGPVEYAKIVQGKEHVREKSKESSVSGAFIRSASFAVAAAKNLPIRSRASVKTVIEDTEHMPSVRSTSCSVHTSTSSPSMLSDATFGKDLQLADLTSKEQGSSSKNSGFEREGRSGSCFSANSFHGQSQGTGGFNSMESLIDEVDPDILLHVPFNMSFQQAELLQQPSWSKPSTKESENKQKQENSEDFVKSRWGAEENSDWEGLFWNAPSPSNDSMHILPNGTVLNPGKMYL